MSIPLVQNNEKDSINTSIIAIKKNLERINSILGLVDSGSDIDTSEFVKKSDIVDVVQSGNMQPVTSNAVATSNAMPVDTVTSGNMHSVTSNAVSTSMQDLENICAYKLISDNPRGNTYYLQITFPYYDKSSEMPLVLLKSYSALYVLGEGNFCKNIAGAGYGVQGFSWTAYTVDTNKFFWIKFNGWRKLHILSTRKMQITAWTTTAPSGVTFSSPT